MAGLRALENVGFMERHDILGLETTRPGHGA